ncbi:B12-binding domain-containing radical SAM protein [Bdellovibrio sp. GT3]|uniref:B12-binding domain-containing radical SAM protein n=1 Tax=Bdellovibrio sp. GT3 TaxID=3136282 RepID=UPI0030EFF151
MKNDILLVTLNSTYQHSSFGLRYLYANLKELQAHASIMEFTTAKDPRDIAEQLLKLNPKIIGLGVYIWNANESYELVSLIKRISPQTIVVLGGPEVTHESETQPICQTADFTFKGEADFMFYDFCHKYLATGQLPEQKFIKDILPEIKNIASPYEFYSDEDIKNRVLYVEVSRGCPYRCEYCLSSLDKSVRNFDITQFLADMQILLDRGARQFKFIDRTFNLSPTICTQILNFFLERIELGLFLHFEMVPDRLPNEIRELIKKFPHGSLQFEIGIQTWNTDVAKLVSRRNDLEKVKENFKFLADETGIHSHADLIVGLPGEDIYSFAKGFDILAGLRPDEIQVGILKRLKGAPISRHDKEWEMVYSEHPPFQILRTKMMDFETLQKMNRFAKYWDLFANSGNFKNFVAALKSRSEVSAQQSFFWEYFAFTEYMSARHAQSFGISLINLVESALIYLTEHLHWPHEEARQLLISDYMAPGTRELPKVLKVYPEPKNKGLPPEARVNLPKRQQRHLSKSETQSS